MFTHEDTTQLHPIFDPVKNFFKVAGSKIYASRSVIERHRKMLEQRYKHAAIQCVMLGILCIIGLLVWIIEFFFPTFFNYPYLVWSVSLSEIARFWPLGLWCLTLMVIASPKVYSSHLDGALWRSGMLTGNLAALWEEIGFRALYICYAMIVLAVWNWIFGSGIGWIVVIAGIFFTVAFIASDDTPGIAAIFSGIASIAAVYFLFQDLNPIYWLYESVIMPTLNFLSFGSFTGIFTDTNQYSPLFVMGAIFANGWFRDGHKYQGLFGLLDSWMFGFVMIFAMLNYGLLTAIVLHMIWNSSLYSANYIRRKIQ